MMVLLDQIDWAMPWGGLVLALPFLLSWLAYRRRSRLAGWAEPHLAPWAFAADGKVSGRGWRSLAGWLAWAMLALAAAGPRLPLEEALAGNSGPARHVMSLVVALDVSASMAAADIAPDRLSRGRLELADLSSRLKGERAGLLLYSGEAGMLLPPTDDMNLFRRAVSQAGPDLIETPGTNVTAALLLAGKILSAEKSRGRAVLLVTDAETGSLEGAAADAAARAAQRLRTAGIPLYVLALASRAGSPIPLAEGGYVEKEGAQIVSRPAIEAYAGLAKLAGGRLVEVSDGDADWQSLYDDAIAKLPGEATRSDQVRSWRMLHTWPLLCALLLFMLAWLPRAAPAAALLAAFMLLPGHDAYAGGSELSAWQAYRSGQFNDAIRLYSEVGGYAGNMGAGAAAWKLKDYSAAQRHFAAALLLARTDAERTDALYNLGNAHFAFARWQTAAEAYRAVLQSRPDDERARTNLAETERQLARKRNEAPIKTDLRGRRGSIAEGEVNVDWDKELAMPEDAPVEGGTLVEEGGDVAGARQQGTAIAARQFSLDARRLQSGLRKLERLEERPRTLLKGVLKQDRAGEAEALELAPW